MKDCIIIGGGPAGLTAALYLARFQRSVTVIDAQQGRAQMIPKTHNLSPFPCGISGRDLLVRMRSHAELYGAEVEHASVFDVKQQGGLFHVKTDRFVETARNIIFATGVINHRPPLSHEDHARGVALGLIRYCPVCDGYEVRDKRIAVLGSGTHGLVEARFIRDFSASVTLIPTEGPVDIAGGGVGLLPSPMKDLSLSDAHVILSLEDGTTAEFDTLYVALGSTARSDLAMRMGADVAQDGCIAVNAKQQTSVECAYAIGDVTEGLDQIAVAMGQGAVASTAIHNTLSATRRRPSETAMTLRVKWP